MRTQQISEYLTIKMQTSLKSRFTAAGLHFLGSAILFSLLFLIIIKIWYPQPFFSASGGWQGLKIVALVDLVLGPLITLLIYNLNKPKKVMLADLGIIVIIQLAALTYGMHAIYTQRPVAMVFWENKFYTIPAQALEKQGINLSSLDQFSNHKPTMIYVEKPTSTDQLKSMLKVINEKRIPPTEQADLYRPIQPYLPNVLKNSINIDEVITQNKDMAKQLSTLLTETNTKQSENYYLVLESKYQNIVLVFTAKSKMIGFLKAPYK